MHHKILSNLDRFSDYYLSDEDEPIKYLPNFGQINIIVGANNSGKSRFMRNLMKADSFINVDSKKLEMYNTLVDEFNDNVNQRVHGSDYHISHLPTNDKIEEVIEKNNSKLSNLRFGFEPGFKTRFSELKKIIQVKKYTKLYYVPTLRTAHSLYERKDKNLNRIQEDIFLETLSHYYSLPKNVEIFTGIDLYKQILNSRNSERNVRKKFHEFEEFLSLHFFERKDIDVVAKFNKDENRIGKTDSELILIHIGNESSTTRTLYDLGDGIQALIILMYKIFMAEQGSLIFIDEPELHLHPGMQRLFLEQISTNAELTKKELTYVISTHSNHLIDLTLNKNNVSIYSFSPREGTKDVKFNIRNVNGGDNELLRSLGVNNTSVFMANCTIWVEGVSDRNYIKAFLNSYLKHLIQRKESDVNHIKEDIDYGFFEYSGSNVDHYIFNENLNEEKEQVIIKDINALALSNRIYLLADSDNATEDSAKGDRIAKLRNIKSVNFSVKVIKEVREIENLLTNDIWKEVLINFCNKKIIDKHKQEVVNRIETSLNKVNTESYVTKYIGCFLKDLSKNIGKIDDLNVLNKMYKGPITKPGTFSDKRELSELVLKADISWDVFSKNPLIKDLTEEIYNFIISK